MRVTRTSPAAGGFSPPFLFSSFLLLLLLLPPRPLLLHTHTHTHTHTHADTTHKYNWPDWLVLRLDTTWMGQLTLRLTSVIRSNGSELFMAESQYPVPSITCLCLCPCVSLFSSLFHLDLAFVRLIPHPPPPPPLAVRCSHPPLCQWCVLLSLLLSLLPIGVINYLC